MTACSAGTVVNRNAISVTMPITRVVKKLPTKLAITVLTDSNPNGTRQINDRMSGANRPTSRAAISVGVISTLAAAIVAIRVVVLEDPPNVPLGLVVRRHAIVLLDGAFARVVAGQRKNQVPVESIREHAKVASAA